MSVEYKSLIDEGIFVTMFENQEDEMEFMAVCTITMDGQTYISLASLAEDGGLDPDEDVFFYTYDDSGAEPVIGDIESDDTYIAVSEAFDDWLDQMEEQG